MDLTFDTPMDVINARTFEVQDRPYLVLAVEGPKRPVDYGRVTGEITFYYQGIKHRTTIGKGATEMDRVLLLDIIEDEGRFELHAQIRANEQNHGAALVRRIAVTNSSETATLMFQTLSDIGFDVKRGIAK